jgi:hypothetical protein
MKYRCQPARFHYVSIGELSARSFGAQTGAPQLSLCADPQSPPPAMYSVT